MDPAPIQTNIAQGQVPQLVGNQQNLSKHQLDLRQKLLAKPGQGRMIWMQPACDEAKGDHVKGRLLDLAGTKEM